MTLLTCLCVASVAWFLSGDNRVAFSDGLYVDSEPVRVRVGLAPAPTATPAACTTRDGKKVYTLLQQYAQEWDDAVHLADSTSRISLAPQIATLQRIRRDVVAQEWPDCGQAAQQHLVKHMDYTIEGFIGFLGQRQDTYVQAAFQLADNELDAFKAELGRVVR